MVPTISDGSNYVQILMFDHSKTKIGCSSSIANRWTRLSSFNVWKNDVWVSLMSNFVNLVKALLVSMFVGSQKLGFLVQSLIGEYVRVCSMFEKWCSSSFDVH